MGTSWLHIQNTTKQDNSSGYQLLCRVFELVVLEKIFEQIFL